MSTVVIEVKAPGGSFSAITSDCLFARTSFTSQFNGAPGSFEVYVRDPLQTHSFATGYEIRCTIDGSNTLGGYVTRVGMTSLADAAAMPVDPADYDMRVWHLTGADYNIVFDRRVFRNTSDYLSMIQINETVDGAILRTAIGSYADMSDFDTSGISDIATIPDINYVLLQQGWLVRKEFETLLPFSGAVYYIDGAKNVIWKSYDDAEKRWGFSDDPNYDPITASPNSYQGSLIGFNSVEATEDATMMANDVLVWGGSEFAGSGGTVFHRSSDSTSITDHGRWQHAETHFGEQWFKTSAGVTAAANAILEGPPGADATGQEKGLKNAQWQFTFTWYSDRVPELSGVRNHIVAGDLVTVNLSTFGVTRLLPVRSITTSFPDAFESDGSHLVEFRATFGLQLSDSFSLWRYVIKNQNRVQVATQTAVTNTSTTTTFGAQYSGTPAPATDGATTVFTIPFGYIPGTTMVFLDTTGAGGLLQEPGVAYNETTPTAGQITFTTAPPVGAVISVVAFTQGAATPTGGGSGGIYYTAPSGSDSTGNGSAATPWRTVGPFLALPPAPGDTLQMRGGSYTNYPGHDVLGLHGTSGAWITIAAYPGETPHLMGPGTSYSNFLWLTQGSSYIAVDGLTMSGFLPTEGGIIQTGFDGTGGDTNHIAVRNCDITQHPSAGITEQILYGSSYTGDFTIEDNILTGNWDGVSNTGTAVNLGSHDPAPLASLVQRNVIKDCRIGVYVTGASTTQVLHNTFVGTGDEVDGQYGFTSLLIQDNVSDGSFDIVGTAYSADHNYANQTLDGNYHLVAGDAAIGGAHDGSNAGAF